MIERLKLKLICLSGLSCCCSVQMLLGFSSLSAVGILLRRPHIIDNRKSMGFFNAVLCVKMGRTRLCGRALLICWCAMSLAQLSDLSSLSELTENQSR